jgi:hypothetical protein
LADKNLDSFDSDHEGREDLYVDIDRMTNEGLAGGRILPGRNGLIEDDTTHTMDQELEETTTRNADEEER